MDLALHLLEAIEQAARVEIQEKFGRAEDAQRAAHGRAFAPQLYSAVPRQRASVQHVAVPVLAALGVIVIVVIVGILASRSPASRTPGEQLYEGIFQYDGRAGQFDTPLFSIEGGQRYSALWTPANCVGGKGAVSANRKTMSDPFAFVDLQNEQPDRDGFVRAMFPPLPTGRYYMTIEGLCSYTFRISRLVN